MWGSRHQAGRRQKQQQDSSGRGGKEPRPPKGECRERLCKGSAEGVVFLEKER